MEPHIAQGVRFDVVEHLGHAIAERLAADERRVGIALRLCGQMLAGPEADLHPQFGETGRKELERLAERFEIERVGLQTPVDASPLARAQRPPGPAAMQDAGGCRAIGVQRILERSRRSRAAVPLS